MLPFRHILAILNVTGLVACNAAVNASVARGSLRSETGTPGGATNDAEQPPAVRVVSQTDRSADVLVQAQREAWIDFSSGLLDGAALHFPVGALPTEAQVRIEAQDAVEGKGCVLRLISVVPLAAAAYVTLPACAFPAGKSGLVPVLTFASERGEVVHLLAGDATLKHRLDAWGQFSVQLVEPLVVDPLRIEMGADLVGSAKGGLPPYTFKFTGSSQSAGTSEVQVVDAAGAKASASVVVAIPLELAGAAEVFAGAKGSLVASGGFAPYRFQATAGVTLDESSGGFTAGATPQSVTFTVYDDAGHAAELAVAIKPKAARALQVGFFTRNGFRLKHDFTETPTCTVGGTPVTMAANGAWTQVAGLQKGTEYRVECESATGKAARDVRTFADTEVMIPAAGVLVDGVSLTGACARDLRSTGVNPVTGSLDIFGAQQCFVTYDGHDWKVANVNFNGDGADFNGPSGIDYDAAGNTYALSHHTDNAQGLLRLYRCKAGLDCAQKTSWDTFTFDDAKFAGLSLCRRQIAFDQTRTRLVINSSACGKVHYECTLGGGSDCMKAADWDGFNSGAGPDWGNGTGVFIDGKGGVWVGGDGNLAGKTRYCPPSADCKLPGGWIDANLPGQTTSYKLYRGAVWQEGSNLRLLAVLNGKQIYASCDLDAVDCGAVAGGTFINFTGGEISLPGVFSIDEGIFLSRTPNGYQAHFYADGFKTRWSECVGDWNACKSLAANWTAPAAVHDGTDYTWQSFYQQNASVDPSGAGYVTVNDWGAVDFKLVYFKN